MGAFDVLQVTQAAARVLHVAGNFVVLDDVVRMTAGESYAIRFRTGLSEADTIGASTIRRVITEEGERSALRLDGGGLIPAVGDLVHFGPAVSESRAMVVHGVEAGEDFTGHLTLIDAAPEIDTLTDDEVPPAWSGVVGSELDDQLSIPAAPVFTAIRTGVTGTGNADGLDILLAPGQGNSAIIGSFDIDHRLSGETVWTTLNVAAADGGASIDGYSSADIVELRARALTPNGTPGPYNSAVSVQIGESDADLPLALGDGSGVVGDESHAEITIVTQNDDNVANVVVYRLATGGVLDRDTHSIGVHTVTKSATLVVIDGDATGQDPSLLPAGTYDYYLEPRNEDDLAAPLAGPFTAVIT